jgi:hypothetical protein
VASNFLAGWILRILQSEGPQDFSALMLLLKSDTSYGYLALRDPHFEAKVRSSLRDNSRGKFQFFIQGYDYKWHALSLQQVFMEDSHKIPRHIPWLEMGNGNETVYAFFFPKTMRESLLENRNSYPIKIGRTSRPLASRMFELQTGNFLDLQAGLAIHTESASKLENYIHKILNHRKVHGSGSQSEWFLTNLEYVATQCKDELKAIVA